MRLPPPIISDAVSITDAKNYLNNLSDLTTNSANKNSFDPKTLLNKIDWKNASQIDSGKSLIGVFEGRPMQNNLKLGFRKAVFHKNKEGRLTLYILEFLPDLAHVKKYNGINSKSFDGKIMIYNQNYELTHGYNLTRGKIDGEILPYKPSESKGVEAIKTDIFITTCSQEGFGYVNAQGEIMLGVTLKCNTEYFSTYNYSPTLQNEETIDSIEDLFEAGNEMGGGGNDQSDITNSVKDSCLKSMVQSSIDSDIKFNIKQSLNSIFNNNDDINLTFEDSNNLSDRVDGETEVIINNYAGQNRLLDVKITLNSNNLSSSSKEYIYATILHETLHAYFRFMNTSLDHNNMSANYIEWFKSSILNTFPLITVFEAEALAWGGLEETSEWNKFPNKIDVEEINNKYKSGSLGQKCQ